MCGNLTKPLEGSIMKTCSMAIVCVGWAVSALAAPPESGRGSYAPLEAAFELPDLSGNPFDYTVNDVMVQLACPNGQTASAPAFFDGGSTWRVRYTPRLAGQYTIRQVTVNGKPAERAEPRPNEFRVTGSLGRGFVRIDPAHKMRFVFDSGEPYYPLGYNVGWVSARADCPSTWPGWARTAGTGREFGCVILPRA
jgi:hypothetical protein